MPDALTGVDQGWTPDRIRQFQGYWNTEFSSDLARRRKAKFVPGYTAVKIQQTKEPEQKNDFDEWLAQAVLPSSTAGYTAYDVPGLGSGRGEGRPVVDNATGARYYTNNHYYSFYATHINQGGE